MRSGRGTISRFLELGVGLEWAWSERFCLAHAVVGFDGTILLTTVILVNRGTYLTRQILLVKYIP